MKEYGINSKFLTTLALILLLTAFESWPCARSANAFNWSRFTLSWSEVKDAQSYYLVFDRTDPQGATTNFTVEVGDKLKYSFDVGKGWVVDVSVRAHISGQVASRVLYDVTIKEPAKSGGDTIRF